MLTMDDYIFHLNVFPQALIQSILFASSTVSMYTKMKYLTCIDETALLEPAEPHQLTPPETLVHSCFPTPGQPGCSVWANRIYDHFKQKRLSHAHRWTAVLLDGKELSTFPLFLAIAIRNHGLVDNHIPLRWVCQCTEGDLFTLGGIVSQAIPNNTENTVFSFEYYEERAQWKDF